MYFEFIIIYILLVIVLGVSLTSLILIIKSSKNGSSKNHSKYIPTVNPSVAQPMYSMQNVPTQAVENNQNSGVVFCTRCAHQFSANEKSCPNCGNPRF